MFKKPIIARLSISAVVFVITSVVAFLVWSQYNEKVKAEQIEQVKVLGEHTRSRVWNVVNADIDHLKNFTNRLECIGDFQNA